MATRCRVWAMYQARCLLCDWMGEIWGYGDRRAAADDARDHRSSDEHRAKLREVPGA